MGKLENLADGNVFTISNIEYQDKIFLDMLVEPEKHEAAMGILSNLTGGQFDQLAIKQELIKS